MELYHLKSFCAVAEEGRMGEAAKRLFLSQPALSAHIKALEEELGVALFLRTPRGMELTEGGRGLLARARTILASSEQLLHEARGMRGELCGDLRLGLNTDAAFLRIPALHAALAEAHPGLALHLLQRSSWTNLDGLRKRELDGGFVFLGSPFDEVRTLRLAEVPLAIAAPAAWADRVEGAELDDLAEMPWIWPTEDCPFMRLLGERFDSLGIRPKSVCRADDEALILDMVSRGVGLSLVRKSEAEAARLAMCPVGPEFSLGLYFAFHRRFSTDPALAALLDAVGEVWDVEESVLAEARELN